MKGTFRYRQNLPIHQHQSFDSRPESGNYSILYSVQDLWPKSRWPLVAATKNSILLNMIKLVVTSWILFFSISSWAVLSGQYRSDADIYISIDRILVFPSLDNIDGIYAKPMDRYLQERLDSNPLFQRVEGNFVGSLLSPIELERAPEEVARIGKKLNVDALVAMSLSKNRSGMNIRINLFSGKDGKLLATEQLVGLDRYEINEIRAQAGLLLDKTLAKLPYKGKVLSRSGNRVTINLGLRDGLKPEDIVSAVQILQLKRHPKFHFLVGAEKEVLGKLKLIKVDETIGFAIILNEKEADLIRPGIKLAGTEWVRYEESNPYLSEAERNKVQDKSVATKISFGEKPREWRPVAPPVFGSAQVRFGLGSYNTGIDNGSVDDSSRKPVFPSLGVQGELWLTPEWTFEGEIHQGVLEIDNNTGTGAATLNTSTTELNFNLAYGLLFQDDFFGPKLQFLFGVHSFRRFIDTSSLYTTTNYSGVALGIRGSLPTGMRREYRFGIELFTHLAARLSESPAATGSSPDSSILRYSFFGERRYRENIWLTGTVNFRSYNTTFSTGSISQNLNQFQAGLKYLF